MSTIDLHLPDETVLEYTLGNCSEAIALGAACHLALCAPCRARAAQCERIGGLLIEALPGVPVAEGSLDRLLARLDEPAPTATPPRPELPEEFRSLPEPLKGYLADAPRRRWRRLAPGVKAIDLAVASPGTTARLVRLSPGFVIPLHDHAGAELTVILSGGLEEEGQLAEPGAVITRVPGERHTQRATPDEGCVALVVNEGPLVPLTLTGRLLQWLTGI